jgi:lysozyme
MVRAFFMNHITQLDEKGIDLILQFEGLSLVPYLDEGGVPTIGYGSTRYLDGTRVKMSDPAISKQMAFDLFNDTISFYEKGVDSITRDDITQGMFNALVSFAYNEGVNKLKGSTLLRKVNANPHDSSIRYEFLRWHFIGRTPNDGLLKRRGIEATEFFS